MATRTDFYLGTGPRAALRCGHTDVPERARPEVLRLYCPAAWRLLAEAGISFGQRNLGRCDAVLCA